MTWQSSDRYHGLRLWRAIVYDKCTLHNSRFMHLIRLIPLDFWFWSNAECSGVNQGMIGLSNCWDLLKTDFVQTNYFYYQISIVKSLKVSSFYASCTITKIVTVCLVCRNWWFIRCLGDNLIFTDLCYRISEMSICWKGATCRTWRVQIRRRMRSNRRSRWKQLYRMQRATSQPFSLVLYSLLGRSFVFLPAEKLFGLEPVG